MVVEFDGKRSGDQGGRNWDGMGECRDGGCTCRVSPAFPSICHQKSVIRLMSLKVRVMEAAVRKRDVRHRNMMKAPFKED